MFENVDGRTDDGRTDDGRTTDARVTGILIAHLGAFSSGELKTQRNLSRRQAKFTRRPRSVCASFMSFAIVSSDYIYQVGIMTLVEKSSSYMSIAAILVM